jgi:hypothetical protein
MVRVVVEDRTALTTVLDLVLGTFTNTGDKDIENVKFSAH